jgi:creatinase
MQLNLGAADMATILPIRIGSETITGVPFSFFTGPDKVIGFESNHISYTQLGLLDEFLKPSAKKDIAPTTIRLPMHKSAAEIELIRAGAATADIGGYAIKEAIKVGAREIDVAMSGRNAMEMEICKRFPDSEIRDTWVWFQSGINTDAAHNPVTCRKLEYGDILSSILSQ